MFSTLTKRLSNTLKNISNRGRLTEKNIKETLREVRRAFLEADVALFVVKKFINDIQSKVIGNKFNQSLTPGQEFIKIVKKELILTMGGENNSLNLSTSPPAVLLIVGPQGAGKTTSLIKLGKLLKEKYKKKVLTVSTDTNRAAAIQQLEILSSQAKINFFFSNINETPTNIAINALHEAQLKFYDILLIDTSGRLHNDKNMMIELQKIHKKILPIETLFVIDSMIGQDSINVIKSFNKELPISGIILSKVDGDARGGIALSIRYITGKPIKFIGTGEKIDAIEIFHPERIADKILGMGDVLSFIEEIEHKFDKKQLKKITNKIKKGDHFNLNDFLIQIQQMRNIGGIANFIGKLPIDQKLSNNISSSMNDKILKQLEAIINSMTPKERKKPEIIKNSRKRRISIGSGVSIQDINKLLKQFNNMQKTMKNIKKMGIKKIFNQIKNFIPKNFLK